MAWAVSSGLTQSHEVLEILLTESSSLFHAQALHPPEIAGSLTTHSPVPYAALTGNGRCGIWDTQSMCFSLWIMAPGPQLSTSGSLGIPYTGATKQ